MAGFGFAPSAGISAVPLQTMKLRKWRQGNEYFHNISVILGFCHVCFFCICFPMGEIGGVFYIYHTVIGVIMTFAV